MILASELVAGRVPRSVVLRKVASKDAESEGEVVVQVRSPRMRRASCMSRGMMVTRRACTAQRLVSSKRPTMCASQASCSAATAAAAD